MVEVVVSRQQREDGFASTSEARPANSTSRPLRVITPLRVLWAAMAAGLVTFLLFGSIQVGAGNWFGRRMSVRQIWTRFLDYLSDLGASPGLVVLVAASAGIALAAAAFALWLAFSLRDMSASEPTDDAA